MKARVKETGEIIEVKYVERKTCLGDKVYMAHEGGLIEESRLDFNVEPIDYWTRLEHQYAGMAMQGIIARHNVDFDMVVEWSADLAHALVEKLKEKEERK